MQLAITLLGLRSKKFINEILISINECQCVILEISCTQLNQATAAYILIEGNWNHIAKFENFLETIQNRLEIQTHSLRIDKTEKNISGMPYSLEIVTLDQDNIIQTMVSFLTQNDISIQEFTASRYQASYNQNLILSAKFVVIIPKESALLSIREQFLDFCDQLNIDAVLEPIKR
jgi:glycine cleavage system transcriptional repressor